MEELQSIYSRNRGIGLATAEEILSQEGVSFFIYPRAFKMRIDAEISKIQKNIIRILGDLSNTISIGSMTLVKRSKRPPRHTICQMLALHNLHHSEKL